MDEVRGPGSAELQVDGTLEIEFVYHQGYEANLKAERATSSTACWGRIGIQSFAFRFAIEEYGRLARAGGRKNRNGR